MAFRLRTAILPFCTLLVLVACSSVEVPMNRPLPRNAAGEPDFAANYGFGSFGTLALGAETATPAARSDLLVFVAFSGGGKRSAAFAHGALRGLRGIPVQPAGQPGWSMLDDVDYISGVSGGSFPAAHYGLYRERHFETFGQDFLKRDVNAYIYGIYLLPWRWDWVVNPMVGTNDYMAQVYDRLMFHGATYADLLRRGPPIISVNATDITNEVSFPFIGGIFGLLCSDLNSFPIARAVAASNGFPVLFTPITIESHAEHCQGRRPPTMPPASWATPASASSRRAELGRILNVYADPEQTRYVHLMDGGIIDNLALRALLNVFVALGGNQEVFRATARDTRRVLILSVDGEAAPDRSLGRQRVVTGLGQIFSAVSGAQIDAFNFETLALARDEVAALVQGLREYRCREARTINGHRCDDVQGTVVHVSLQGIDDPAERARLQSIPTGLTIPDADVDALVEYGERLVSQHPEIRAVAAAAGTNLPPGTVTVARAPRRNGR
ncbi:patatin-like phospholipase family protein [Roseomonas eburnea]|uniref:Patatin-like phospholipase family protein n=1 Tax=Neoroseomonas eburnea TaxID=1346889 RepID=A0A9X9XE96_9PROT|nr:patatin-like phospholipase family protein [Neoroseomonas eburnea]MBR0682032.1 patatin-like phospholipase family protein [Neoroseomonas eburnea]